MIPSFPQRLWRNCQAVYCCSCQILACYQPVWMTSIPKHDVVKLIRGSTVNSIGFHFAGILFDFKSCLAFLVLLHGSRRRRNFETDSTLFAHIIYICFSSVCAFRGVSIKSETIGWTTCISQCSERVHQQETNLWPRFAFYWTCCEHHRICHSWSRYVRNYWADNFSFKARVDFSFLTTGKSTFPSVILN